jgi:hypothetical protein
MPNENLAVTLDDAVAEVMGALEGMDLQYVPELDKYQSVTRALNRALRLNATEINWSYYSSTEDMGVAHAGDRFVVLRASVRPRIIRGDAVRLCDPDSGRPLVWAYFLPREDLHIYPVQAGLWVANTNQNLEFSRPFLDTEDGLTIKVPVMREPVMFRLPPQPEDENQPLTTVPADVREQLVDFNYPDLIIARAMYLYAQTNAMWQPRVQTLEAAYKDLFYSLKERDESNTDSPLQNDWNLGIEPDITYVQPYTGRPSADPWRMSNF